MGEKVGFTNSVFEKLCSSENAILRVFSAKHSSCSKKLYVEKKRKFMKNCGLLLNMAKGCFLVCLSGFNVFWFVLCVFSKVAKVLKKLVSSPVYWVIVGRLLLVHLGL